MVEESAGNVSRVPRTAYRLRFTPKSCNLGVKSKEQDVKEAVVETSRLSSKGQVTIPKRVREVLSLEAGDVVGYEVVGGEVFLRRVEPFDSGYHLAVSETLSEWVSPEDESAFNDL